MDRYSYLKQFHNISSSDYELLSQYLKPKMFNTGEIVVKPGETHRELYFINSGILMPYFETDKKIHVIAFTYAPGVCVIPESFAFERPSNYYLKCLSECEVECLTFESLMNLFDENHQIERLFRKMTEAVLVGVINRHVELHTKTIKERYVSFCSRSSHLLQMVPHKYIASYLGIDPTNFSKLYNTVKI
ncbi:MAG: Crp/Fnr family transcriptional regulator [Balneolaceae bacterium]|nr:Crp/Fnr family transcriptional regulator [Balneolaceae bacterium]